jgi:hypothetical protein
VGTPVKGDAHADMLYLDMHRFIHKVCDMQSDRTCREPNTYDEIEKLIHTNIILEGICVGGSLRKMSDSFGLSQASALIV